MADMFYRNFEERYRGSFELIKARLQVYLPFIEPLKNLDKKPTALDLGCGRGEWLELLQQHGFQAKGVDLNEGMLEACQKRNLDVVQGDAIQYIKNMPSGSLHVISAFHFVEHIPFDTLQQFVHEAERALKPGGILILETPNPENLLVGTSSFYLDPTHQRPIPSQLLSFVVEHHKFKRVKTLFLQEPTLAASQQIGLNDVLEGVSPDFAVVAQKNADNAHLALFDASFNTEYGTRLSGLAKRYDHQVKTTLQNQHIAHQEMRTQIDALHHRLRFLENLSIFYQIRRALRLIKRTAKTFLKWAMRQCLARPKIKAVILKSLVLFPSMKERLRHAALSADLSDFVSKEPSSTKVFLSTLSPRATQIYNELSKAIKKGRTKCE
jgi:O-antigen chain-terminating methyltransferase